MITGAALAAAEAADVRAVPARVQADPEGSRHGSPDPARGRAGLEVPASLNLPLVGVPPDRYGDRYAAVPRHTVPPSAAG